MRERLKSHDLSFTEIAKLTGKNWQRLHEAERGSYESQADAAKEKYRSSFAEYKKSPEYRRYANYLEDFKEKQDNRHQSGNSYSGKLYYPV